MTDESPIPATALDYHTAVLGKTGSGKSFAAQGEVERLIAAKQRVCLVDPTDRYWGLRLSPDGKKPSGHDIVIFGGNHADLPLAATHGAALGEIVGTTATPVIIATRLMTVGDRTRFFIDFAETLLRKNEGPLHLVIDEAHLFAPKGKVSSVDSARMLNATNNLVSLGRGVGLRIMLISQRPAKLHNDCLGQVETLVALRLILPHDRNAIREWIKEWADEATGAEMMKSLPSLPTGTGWVWSPELGILHKGKFPPIRTFDSGKPSAAIGKGPALIPIDLAAVRGKLEVVASEAFANDPGRLRKRIGDLEAELRKAPKQQIDETALSGARAEGYGRGKIEGYAEALRLAGPFIAPLRKLAAEATELAKGIDQWAQTKAPAPASAAIAQPAPAPAPRNPAAGNGHAPAKPRADGITGPQQRILDALAWWKSVGVSAPDRIQVAVVAGYNPDGGAFSNPLGALRTSGLVEYPQAGAVTLTAEGRAQANMPGEAPTNEALHEKTMAILDGPKRRILGPLLRAYPDAMTREDLAAAAQYDPNGGAFSNPLGALRSLGLVAYPAKGQVRAEPVLFIGGGA